MLVKPPLEVVTLRLIPVPFGIEIYCVPLELLALEFFTGVSVSSRAIVPLLVETLKLWQLKSWAVILPLLAELSKSMASKFLSFMLPLVVLIRLSPPEKLEQAMFPLEADKERFLAEPASIRILPLLVCTESFPVWT